MQDPAMHSTTEQTAKADSMTAKLRYDSNERTFAATMFETGTAFGNRWFNGIQGNPEDSFTHIALKLPESEIRQGARLEIGEGEEASISAYYGSRKFARSGWAKNGELIIKRWDAASRQLQISFSFRTNDNLEAIEGDLDCTLLKWDEDERAGNTVKATITPPLFTSLGNLNADHISFKRSGDSSLLLIATQGNSPQLQGVRITFTPGANFMRAFFRIDNGLVDFQGGTSHFEWDDSAHRLKCRFSGRKFSHVNDEHTVDNADIDVTLSE